MDSALERIEGVLADLRYAAELVIAAAQEMRRQAKEVPRPPPETVEEEALRLSRLARQIAETIPLVERMMQARRNP